MDVSGDLEGEVVEGGEEEELDAVGTHHEPVDENDVEGNHQEELNEENLVGESVEDDEPMVQNHQPDGLAELVSNLGVDVEGIDVGVAEEGLDLEPLADPRAEPGYDLNHKGMDRPSFNT